MYHFYLYSISFLSSIFQYFIANSMAKFGRTGSTLSGSAVTSDVTQCDCTSCRSEGVVPSSLISSFLSLWRATSSAYRAERRLVAVLQLKISSKIQLESLFRYSLNQFGSPRIANSERTFTKKEKERERERMALVLHELKSLCTLSYKPQLIFFPFYFFNFAKFFTLFQLRNVLEINFQYRKFYVQRFVFNLIEDSVLCVFDYARQAFLVT